MINKTIFIEQLKRFWAIPVISTLLFISVLYVPMRVNQGDYSTMDWDALYHLVTIISMGDRWLWLFMIATPVITAFCMFECFFVQNAATVFYSLPINKKQLLITKAFAGIIISVIPITIFCIVLLFPLQFHDNILELHEIYLTELRYSPDDIDITVFSTPQSHLPKSLLPNGTVIGEPMNTFPIISSLYARMFITTLFYFAVAWLAFAIAGHKVVALVLVGTMPFVPILFMFLIELIARAYIFGFPNIGVESFIVKILMHQQPAFFYNLIRHSPPHTYTASVTIPLIVYSVNTVLLFVAAYYVSRIRKTERTGNSIVFNSVRNVLILMLSFIGMYLFGTRLYTIFSSTFMMHIGFIVGFTVGYVVAWMIAEKSLYNAKKLKILPYYMGIAAALYIVMLLFTQYGMSFYVNRVPAQSEIAAVYVTNTLSYRRPLSDDEWVQVSYSDAETIAAARAAHETIINGKNSIFSIPHLRGNAAYWGTVDGEYISVENFFIRYILNDGTIVARSYSLTNHFIYEVGLNEFLDSEAIVLSEYTMFRMPEMLHNITFTFGTSNWKDTFELPDKSGMSIEITDREQIETALKIIAQGVVENAANTNRRTYRGSRWEAEPSYEDLLSPYVNVRFGYNPASERIIYTWLEPVIYDMPALLLMEHLEEWGLLQE